MRLHKFLFCILLLFSVFQLNAQSLPNAGFENWHMDAGYEVPDNWDCTTRFVWYDFQMYGVIKDSSDSYEGNYCALLETDQDIAFTDTVRLPGLLSLAPVDINIMDYSVSIGDPIAFTGKPDGLRMHYKYFPVNQDTAIVRAYFTMWNNDTQQQDTIGYGALDLFDTTDVWTAIDMDIDYSSESIPEYVNVLISSSKPENLEVGSKLFIDSVGFEYSGAGIDKINEGKKCIVYPQPANNLVTVSWASKTIEQVQLFDLSMKELTGLTNFESFSSGIILHTENLRSGVYFIRINEQYAAKLYIVK